MIKFSGNNRRTWRIQWSQNYWKSSVSAFSYTRVHSEWRFPASHGGTPLSLDGSIFDGTCGKKWMIWGLFLMTLDTSQWSDGLFWWCEAMLQGRSLLDRMVAILLGEASLDISHISHISQLQTCCFSWNISDGSKLESCEQCGLINIGIIGLMETLCFFFQK